jgi:hypothetical protein
MGDGLQFLVAPGAAKSLDDQEPVVLSTRKGGTKKEKSQDWSSKKQAKIKENQLGSLAELRADLAEAARDVDSDDDSDDECVIECRKLRKVIKATMEIRGKTTRVDRTRRLTQGPCMVLYHETDEKSAGAILESGRMLRGDSGLVGGGIYFACTKQGTFLLLVAAHAYRLVCAAAKRKAHRHGYLLKCKVRLGYPKRIAAGGNPNVKFTKLLKQGFDSVIVPRKGGLEFVVYNYDQVVAIKFFKSSK